MKNKLKIIITSLLIVCATFFGGIDFSGDTSQCLTHEIYGYGYSNEYTTKFDEAKFEKVEELELSAELEESYNLRDYIYIKVENQEQYGLCYTFASLTMLETYLAKAYNEYYDFSEIHMATAKYVEDKYESELDTDYGVDFDEGGNFANFYSYATKGIGPVLEDEMPFYTFYSTSNTDNMEDLATTYYNTYKSDFSKLVSVDKFVSFSYETSTNEEVLAKRNAIKSHIKNYSACISSICGTSSLFSNTNGYIYLTSSASNRDTNHMITIVGWDDNFAVPGYSKAGAYICLNSWGESWGNNGYFYVSYYDSNIEEAVYGISQATLSNSSNSISNATSAKDMTLSEYISGSSSQAYVASVVDVSGVKNSYINKIETSLLSSGDYKFYLHFTDKPTTETMLNFSPNNPLSVTLDADFIKTGIIGDTLISASLNTPVKITNNYAILVVYVSEFYGMRVWEDGTTYTDVLKNTYWFTGSSFFAWYPDTSTNSSIITCTRFTISSTQTSQDNVLSNFSSDYTLNIDDTEFDYNNATFISNAIGFTVTNPSSAISNSNISIYSVNATNSNLNKTEQTSSFEITTNFSNNVCSITLTPNSTSLSIGNYILKLTISNKIFYKSFEILEGGIYYNISYILNGGENNSHNSNIYLATDNSIKLYSPTRLGYTFIGWFTDSGLTQAVSGNNGSDINGDYISYIIETKTNLAFYASWTLSGPVISIQPINISNVYTGASFTTSLTATHPLVSSSNPLTYSWYYSSDNKTWQENQNLISNILSVKNVSDSGYYKCVVSFTNGETMSTTSNIIEVNITKADYEISWNYDSNSPFIYNNQLKSVGLNGANKYGNNIQIGLSNNTATNAGNYTASAVITNNSENYNDITLPNLNWKIKPASLIIDINDVNTTSETEFSNYTNFSYTLTGTIYDDYSFNLTYNTTSTSDSHVKLINANYTPNNSNYEIIINSGTLRLIKMSLTVRVDEINIKISSEEGYSASAEFTATSLQEQQLSANAQKHIEQNNLIVYKVYSLSLSNDEQKTNQISIELNPNLLDKNIKIYQITNEGLKLVESEIVNGKINFTANIGDFIIAEAPEEYDLQSVLIALGIILGLGLLCCITINIIRQKRKKKYDSKTDYVAH